MRSIEDIQPHESTIDIHSLLIDWFVSYLMERAQRLETDFIIKENIV